MAEPRRRGRIDGLLVIIAQEGDCVPFDVSAQAFRSRFVLDGEPEKRHVADHGSDHSFQGLLDFSDFTGRRVALAPGRIVETVPLDQGRSHDSSENRSPVIAAAGTCYPFMLPKGAFQSLVLDLGFRACVPTRTMRGQSPGIGANLARLHEKIYSARRPIHAAGTIGQSARSAETLFKRCEKSIKLFQMVEA